MEAYDIVLLGASGFTGKYVVREALKFLNAPLSPLKTLALAGRNPSKLSQTLKWAAHPNPPPPSIPILTADTSDPHSLRRLASQQSSLFSIALAHFASTESLWCLLVWIPVADICGEPEFMERIEAMYHDKAVEKGSLVISAYGFDSIPAEMGLQFNSRQWGSPAAPNRVEAYLSLESDKKIAGNFGTFQSAVLAVANADKLQELRRSRPRRTRPLGNTKPDMEIITRVMGPEIGYLTTPIVLLQCALILLSQRKDLPKGGVFPPGIVFGSMGLQERLQENGLSFDVITKSTLSSQMVQSFVSNRSITRSSHSICIK